MLHADCSVSAQCKDKDYLCENVFVQLELTLDGKYAL